MVLSMVGVVAQRLELQPASSKTWWSWVQFPPDGELLSFFFPFWLYFKKKYPLSSSTTNKVHLNLRCETDSSFTLGSTVSNKQKNNVFALFGWVIRKTFHFPSLVLSSQSLFSSKNDPYNHLESIEDCSAAKRKCSKEAVLYRTTVNEKQKKLKRQNFSRIDNLPDSQMSKTC